MSNEKDDLEELFGSDDMDFGEADFESDMDFGDADFESDMDFDEDVSFDDEVSLDEGVSIDDEISLDDEMSFDDSELSADLEDESDLNDSDGYDPAVDFEADSNVSESTDDDSDFSEDLDLNLEDDFSNEDFADQEEISVLDDSLDKLKDDDVENAVPPVQSDKTSKQSQKSPSKNKILMPAIISIVVVAFAAGVYPFISGMLSSDSIPASKNLSVDAQIESEPSTIDNMDSVAVNLEEPKSEKLENNVSSLDLNNDFSLDGDIPKEEALELVDVTSNNDNREDFSDFVIEGDESSTPSLIKEDIAETPKLNTLNIQEPEAEPKTNVMISQQNNFITRDDFSSFEMKMTERLLDIGTDTYNRLRPDLEALDRKISKINNQSNEIEINQRFNQLEFKNAELLAEVEQLRGLIATPKPVDNASAESDKQQISDLVAKVNELDEKLSNLRSKEIASLENKEVSISKVSSPEYVVVGGTPSTAYISLDGQIMSFSLGEVVPGYGKIILIKPTGEVITDKGILK